MKTLLAEVSSFRLSDKCSFEICTAYRFVSLEAFLIEMHLLYNGNCKNTIGSYTRLFCFIAITLVNDISLNRTCIVCYRS